MPEGGWGIFFGGSMFGGGVSFALFAAYMYRYIARLDEWYLRPPEAPDSEEK